MISDRDDETVTPCVHDPDLFFPDGKDELRYAEAQQVCAGCPKRVPCMAYAIRNGETFGVWGGHDFGRAAREQAPQPIEFHPDGWPVEVPRDRCTARYCQSGEHEFTPDNTLWSRQHGTITRSCRACRRNYRAQKRLRRKKATALRAA